MNGNRHIRKLSVLILVTVLLLMNLSACGGSAEESGPGSEASWRENAEVKVFGIDLTQEETAVENPAQVVCGKRSAWVITTKRGDYIYRFDYSTDASVGKAAEVEWQQADTEYLVNIAESGGTLYIEVRDIETNVIEIRKRKGASWDTLMSLEMGEEAWAYVGSGFFVDSSGNVYLVSGDVVTCFNAEGKQAGKYELGGSVWIFSENRDGYVDCVVTESDEIVLYTLRENVAEREWALGITASEVYSIQSNQDERLCLAIEGEILFLDRDTGEVLERADLASIGVSFFDAGYYDAETDTLWLYGQSGDVSSQTLVCSLLSGRDAGAAAQRIELVYAVTKQDSRVVASIMDFNQSNDKYYITMKDYSSGNGGYADWEAAIQRLTMELASGKGPDLIQMSFTLGSYDAYVNNGYLVDLRPYLEQSEYADDLLWNVLDTYGRNGGLYQLVPHFLLYRGLTVHPDYADSVEEWNMAAFLDLIEQDQWDKNLYYSNLNRGPENLLYSILLGVQDDYADWEQKKAFFDTEGFIELLKLCKEYGEQSWPDEDYDNPDLLVHSVFFVTYGDLAFDVIGRYGHAYPVYGYPTLSGQRYQIGYSYDSCAINANSDNIEGAWEFVESLLTDSYQDMHGEGNTGFPIRDSALQRAAEAAQEVNYMVDGSTCEITDDDIKVLNDIFYNGELFTIQDRDSLIRDIILEEAGAYFAGDKSAEEVAHVIQNRVQLMLDEY